MEDYYIEITFDFNLKLNNEKNSFIDFLKNEQWINLETDKNWRVYLTKCLNPNDKVKTIKNTIKNGSKIAKLNKLDYAIISNDVVYLGSIN